MFRFVGIGTFLSFASLIPKTRFISGEDNDPEFPFNHTSCTRCTPFFLYQKTHALPFCLFLREFARKRTISLSLKYYNFPIWLNLRNMNVCAYFVERGSNLTSLIFQRTFNI